MKVRAAFWLEDFSRNRAMRPSVANLTVPPSARPRAPATTMDIAAPVLRWKVASTLGRSPTTLFSRVPSPPARITASTSPGLTCCITTVGWVSDSIAGKKIMLPVDVHHLFADFGRQRPQIACRDVFRDVLPSEHARNYGRNFGKGQAVPERELRGSLPGVRIQEILKQPVRVCPLFTLLRVPTAAVVGQVKIILCNGAGPKISA